jgi:subtilase family serine protease
MPQGTRRRSAASVLALGSLGLGSLTMVAGVAAAATPAAAATRTAPARAGAGARRAASSAQSGRKRVTIPGTHPSWAVAARRRGDVTTGEVHARVYLAARDDAGLSAAAIAESTPGNARYRHFLSPAAVQARFGSTPAQRAAVRAWLTGSGLTVTGRDDHLADGYLAVRGSVTAASRAFHVRFARYRTHGGHTARAPQRAASVPAAVAASVLDITGLSSAPQVMRPLDVPVGKLPPPGPNFWTAPPCGRYYTQKIARSKPRAYGRHQPWAVCGYRPRQIRRVYGVTASGMTGRGQTVAVVDAYASPTMPSDANTYARVVGDRPFAPGQYQQFLPGSFRHLARCSPQDWYGEQTLDIEAVHGMAPRARVRFVSAASCDDQDLAAALARVVNRHLASIVSNSFGDPTDVNAPFRPVYHLILRVAAAEGIAVMFSSGDDGYDSSAELPGSDKIQVEYPASDPFATAVGGTSLAIGRHRDYLFETSWGTILNPLASSGRRWQFPLPGPYPAQFDGGSGGGTSTVFRQPRYQRGVVPRRLSHRLPGGSISRRPMRVIPDVSAFADPATGFLVGQTVLQPNGKTFRFSLSRTGGTSLSSPAFAAIQADAQQAAGGPLGFANPAIYCRFGTRAYRDVTDRPLGRRRLAQVRPDYTDPTTRALPILYNLRTLGIDGRGAAALRATRGYDNATGVGSPRDYIKSFRKHRHRH